MTLVDFWAIMSVIVLAACVACVVYLYKKNGLL